MRLKRKVGSMDWEDIQRRLEQSRLAMDHVTKDDRDRQEQILRERAVALAHASTESAAAASPSGGIDVLAFRAAGERYAFETFHVAQAYPMLPLTAIPGVPDFVVGIVAARGEVLSVIDLRSLLDLPLARLDEPGAIILLESEDMAFGVLADEVLGVERYAAEDLESVLPGLDKVEKTYLKGVAPNRTAILDAGRLLRDPGLVINGGQYSK